METQIVCKNIFRSGENMISKDEFTRQWAALINQWERQKENSMQNQADICCGMPDTPS